MEEYVVRLDRHRLLQHAAPLLTILEATATCQEAHACVRKLRLLLQTF